MDISDKEKSNLQDDCVTRHLMPAEEVFCSTPHDVFMAVDFCFISRGEVSLLTSADP